MKNMKIACSKDVLEFLQFHNYSIRFHDRYCKAEKRAISAYVNSFQNSCFSCKQMLLEAGYDCHQNSICEKYDHIDPELIIHSGSLYVFDLNKQETICNTMLELDYVPADHTKFIVVFQNENADVTDPASVFEIRSVLTF